MAGIYESIKCKQRRTNEFIPTPYQSYVIDYFINRSTFKGLLLYHKLGAGKTCTSVLIADQMIRTNQVQKVYVLTPGSLRVNWIDEYCKKCGDQFITTNFIFMTYNSNLQLRINNYDFNNSLIIIDEAHNLINGVKNMTKNAYITYKKIYESNCRVLLLTGTPIIQYTWEWSLMGNLLKPRTFMDIMDKTGITPGKFSVAYKGDGKQDEMYKGIVSYYPGDPSLYPVTNYHEPIKCEMVWRQYMDLVDQMGKDRIQIAIGPPKKGDPDYIRKHTQYIRAVKAVTSRSISNCFYENPLIRMYTLLSEKLPNVLDKIIAGCKEDLEGLGDGDDDTKKILKLRKKLYIAKIKSCEVEKELVNIRFQIFRNGYDQQINFQTLDNWDPAVYQGFADNDLLVEMGEKKIEFDEANRKVAKYKNKLAHNYNILVRFKGEEDYLFVDEKFYHGEKELRRGVEEQKGDVAGVEERKEGADEVKEEDDFVFVKFGTKWIEDDLFFSNYENILINLSRKYVALLINITSRINTKHVIFSFFKTGIGFETIGKLLNRANITYGIFSGDIDDKERRRILEVFNSPENRDGKIMNVLLITEAGAEGISLLETNNMHILESSTKEHKITQAIGRVARIYSHMNMPKERQYVNVWRYWSTVSKKTDEPSEFVAIDESLYRKGVEAETLKNQFLQEKLIANSIETVLPLVMPPRPATYANKLGRKKITLLSESIKFRDVDVLEKPNIYAFLPMTTATTVFPTVSVEFMNAHGLPLPVRNEIEKKWATVETRNQAGTYEVIRAPDGANVILAYIQSTLRAPAKESSDPIETEPETFEMRVNNVNNILDEVIPTLPAGSTLIFPRTLGGTATNPEYMEVMHDRINYISNQHPEHNFVLYR